VRTAAAPEDILAQREDRALLQEAIDRLPGRAREALVLYYLRGQSAAETSRALGITQEAVRKRLDRARRGIRNHMADRAEGLLEKWRPDDQFAEGTLAAIPMGSICAKLGITVTRIGAGEALQHIANVAAQKASTVITGGGMIMTAKQAVVGSVVGALLLAASLGTNVALVVGGEKGPEEAALPAVTEQDLADARAETQKALAEKDELARKLVDLEKEVERQKEKADAAWQSRQALADELGTIEGKLGQELAKLQGPEGQDDLRGLMPTAKFRGPQKGDSKYIIGGGTLARNRRAQTTMAVKKYFWDRGALPASLTELVGSSYLPRFSREDRPEEAEVEEHIIDPYTKEPFEYESGVNKAGDWYFTVTSAYEGGLKDTTVFRVNGDILRFSSDGNYTFYPAGMLPPSQDRSQ